MRIIEQGLSDGSKTVRVAAARGLVRIDHGRSVRRLEGMLADPDPEVRAAALAALVPHVAQGVALGSAVVELCQDPSASVRAAAYGVVAAAADTGVKGLLLAGLGDVSARVREVAYAGLALFAEHDLVRQGLMDTDPLVRIATARALARLGEAGMAEFMIEELKKLPPDLLGPAIIMYAELGDTAALGQLRQLAREAPAELRLDASEALLMLGDRAGVEPLKHALASNDPFVRLRAVATLTRIDVPELRPLSVAATRDEYVTVAVAAVEALAAHDAAGNRDLFLELMDAPRPLLRLAAAAAYLGK